MTTRSRPMLAVLAVVLAACAGAATERSEAPVESSGSSEPSASSTIGPMRRARSSSRCEARDGDHPRTTDLSHRSRPARGPCTRLVARRLWHDPDLPIVDGHRVLTDSCVSVARRLPESPRGRGACLGILEAGTYSTSVFEVPLTYTVTDGWGNYEDLPGNFLLVPPGGSLEGVNAGTSDFIGLYYSSAPAAANCDERPEPGIATTPEAMATWFAGLPGLEMTDPEPMTVGGLSGFVMDIDIADGYADGCPYPGSRASRWCRSSSGSHPPASTTWSLMASRRGSSCWGRLTAEPHHRDLRRWR